MGTTGTGFMKRRDLLCIGLRAIRAICIQIAKNTQILVRSLIVFLRVLPQRWRGGVTGKAFGLAISRSQVQILLEAMLRNNLRQVVYIYVPLSPSSITWYRR